MSSVPSPPGRYDWLAGTLSNFWSDDQSWFVWDLWGLKESGPSQLIDALVEPELEIFAWPRPMIDAAA